jgi:protein-disulfide isomerase
MFWNDARYSATSSHIAVSTAPGQTGAPAFVADRKALLSGVQPVENASELIEHVCVEDAR